MQDTPQDPREYTGLHAEVPPIPAAAQPLMPATSNTPAPLSNPGPATYDLRTPEIGEFPTGPDPDTTALEQTIDRWAAWVRLAEHLNGPPVKHPEPVLTPDDFRLDDSGYILSGPGLSPEDSPAPHARLPFSQPTTGGTGGFQQPRHRSLLHGLHDENMLHGGSGDDQLPPASAESNPNNLNQRQQEALDAVKRRLPEITRHMVTPDGRREVLRWLPHLKTYSDEKLRERGVNFGMVIAEILNGLTQDAFSSAMKGLGRPAQIATAQTQQRLQDALASKMGRQKADRLIADLDAMQHSDPERHRRIIEGLDRLTTTDKAVKLLRDTLVGGGEMLERLAIDTGIPAEDRPMVLNLARGAGSILPYLGNPTSMFGRALFAAMTIGQASETAFMELQRAGISPQNPAAPVLWKLGTAISLVANAIPFEKLTGKLGRGTKNGQIQGLTDLLGRMPPDKRVRYLSVIGVMARDGAISALTGFLELTLTRLVNWHTSGGPEDYPGDVWDFVLEGQADDAEMNAIMGALAPQMMKIADGTTKRVRQKKNLNILWSGARRNFHQKPLPGEFFTFLSRVTGKPVVQLKRNIGQVPGPDEIRDKTLNIRQRHGDHIPAIDDPHLTREIADRFQDMPVGAALDLDAQARRSASLHDLGDTLTNPDKARALPTGSVANAKSAYANWQDTVLLYQHTHPLREQFEADQQTLGALPRRHPGTAEDADTMLELNRQLEQNGDISVRDYARFADAVRQQAARIHKGEADALDLDEIARKTGAPDLIAQIKKARQTVRARAENVADRAHRRLRALDPTFPPLADIRQQQWVEFLKLPVNQIPDADDFRRLEKSADAENADTRQLEQALTAALRRKFVEQMVNDTDAHKQRMRRLSKDAPRRASQFRRARNLVRNLKIVDDNRPGTVAEQRRLWDFARAVADDPDGVHHMNRDMVLELLSAMRSNGTLAEIQNVRLNQGLTPGAPGAPFRIIMRGLLARVRYAADLNPAQIDQAKTEILRRDPDRAETWHAIFSLLDTVQMGSHTRNLAQLKTVADAAATLTTAAKKAERQAKSKPKPEPDDNTDNRYRDDGRTENEGDGAPDNIHDQRATIKHRFEHLIGSAIERTYKSYEPWDKFQDRPWGKYIKETLHGVNPHLRKGGPNNNCVSCVLAATRRLTGKDPDAISEPSTGAVWPNNLLPEYPWGAIFDTNLSEIEAELTKQGDGSVAAVIINQQLADPHAPQHVILAVFKYGEIIYADPQIGAIVELNLESGMTLDARYQW